MNPLILIIYNEPELADDHPDALSEHSIVEVAETVNEVLKEAGYRVGIAGVTAHPNNLLAVLEKQRPSLVFNLFEGTHMDGQTEAYVTGILQWLDIPITGASFETLALARHKDLTKQLLLGAGLPTPNFYVVDDLPIAPCPLKWPVIVKPTTFDASVGIDQDSVATNQKQLEHRLTYIVENYGTAMVEELIIGRELHVPLIEDPDLRHTPPSEILFNDEPGFWPILTYDGKWHPDTPDYDRTPPKFPAELSPEQREMIGNLAMRAFELLGCRDYARIDFRLSSDGKPFILEVNPNPEISSDAGFALALQSAGIKYGDFIVQIAKNGLDRAGLSTEPKNSDSKQVILPLPVSA